MQLISSFRMLVGFLLVAGCGLAPEQRLLTRGAISGRVVLDDADGVNDMSRVRVDLGNGEGGVAVDDDGLFLLSDLEADVYTLTVSYAGGLVPTASGSAYQTFARRVPLPEGAAVDVGDLVLSPATGRVIGRVGFEAAPDGSEAPADVEGVVRLLLADGDVREALVAADGSFAFAEVPVGFHAAEVDREGFAVPVAGAVQGTVAASSACGAQVAVVQADEEAQAGTLRLVQARASLQAGQGQLVALTPSTWWLAPGNTELTVNITSGYARQARVWLDDEQAPPPFSTEAIAGAQLAVSPGRHRLFVQTGDGCRFTSPVLEVTVIRDEEPPTIAGLVVAGARVGSDGRALLSTTTVASVVVTAFDAGGAITGVAVTTIPADEDVDSVDPAALTVVDVNSSAGAPVVADLVLPVDDGAYQLVAFVRDESGNISSPGVLPLLIDQTPPLLRSVVIGDGLPLLRSASTIVSIVAEGASFMRVGVDAAAALAPLVVFAPQVPVTFAGDDGDKRVQVVTQDEAGNVSEAVVALAKLVSRGDLIGSVVVEDNRDLTTLDAVLVGTAHVVNVLSDGSFRFSAITQDQYVLRVRVAVGAPLVVEDRIVAVVAGADVNAGVLYARTARGVVVGTVTKERATDHSGISVEVLETARSALTGSAGVFELSDVPAGLYQVRLSAPGFVPVLVPAVQVREAVQTVLDPQQLALVRGALVGSATRDDDEALSRDHGGLTVTLFGNDTSATAITNGDGSFRFDGVLPGFFSLEVSSDGYQSQRENAVHVEGGVDNNAGSFVVTRKRGVVTGVVLVEGRAQSAGVRVSLLDSPLVTFTDATGRYELSAPVGNYGGARASLAFFTDAFFDTTVTVTESGTFTVSPLTLQGQSGLLSGTVLLADALTGDHTGTTIRLEGITGTPTANVRVVTATDNQGTFAFDETETFQVEDAGAFAVEGAVFAFPGLPVGSYRVTAMPPLLPGAVTDARETASAQLVITGGVEAIWGTTLRTLFIVINQSAPLTKDPLLRLDLGASNCFRMQLRIDAVPDETTPQQVCSTPVTGFNLGTTQGTRQVFASFLTPDGVLIGTASDSIVLDTVAQITTFSHGISAGRKLDFGASVTFTARTGEPRGRATVAIAGYDTNIVLAEGGAGCAAGEVGCYGRTYELLQRIDIKPTSAGQASGPGTTTVSFTDESGNVATARASSALEIAIAPIISGITVVPDLALQNATVSFATDEFTTGVARPGRAEASLCVSACPTTALAKSHSLVITGAHAGEPGGVFLRNKAYFVRVEASDAKGNVGASAVRVFFLQPDPPLRVVPIAMDARVLVRWEAPPQEDVAGYYVERSADGAAFERVSGPTPYNHEVLTFDDRSVENGRSYGYRVRAVDAFGNASEPATTTDMAKDADGATDAGKLAAFSACGEVTPAAATSTAGTDVSGGVLPLCSVWTKAGGPYRVNASIASPAGGIFIIGPGVDVKVAADKQIIVQGRLGIYGDRGTFFDLPNDGFADIDPLITNGVPEEEPTGRVTFDAQAAGGSWRGMFIRNAATFGVGKVSVRGYRNGDVASRAALLKCSGSCWDADSKALVIRSVIAAVSDISEVNILSPGLVIGGSKLPRSVRLPRDTAISDSAYDLIISDIIASSGFTSSGTSGTSRRRGGSGNVFDGFQADDSLLAGRHRGVFVGGSIYAAASEVDGRGDSVLLKAYFAAIHTVGSSALVSGRIFSSVQVAKGDKVSRGTSPGGLTVTTRVFGSLTAEAGAAIEKSTLVTSHCAVQFRLIAGSPIGSDGSLPGTNFDCHQDLDGNVDTITDFYDDVTLGVLRLDTSFTGSFPRPMIDGPMQINLPALKRGVTLRIYGDDLEDGPLPTDAGYWTSDVGVPVGDGPLLTLPTTLPVGTTTFRAHVVDSDGLDSDIPWPVEVKNDSGFSDSWIWPDADRWRVAAIRLDQLPPKTNAIDVATFRYRCFTPGCTTTCSFDGEAEAPCRSPVEIAALGSGNHTMVFQARDEAGHATDLPQRYTWSVLPAELVQQKHAAPTVRLTNSPDGAATVEMLSGHLSRHVVTCSVDGRHERPCNNGLSVHGVAANGEVARELTIRVRVRKNGLELLSPRGVHLNDPEDLDGDGWLDSHDSCLDGAERGDACNDPDQDDVDGLADQCPFGEAVADPRILAATAGDNHICALFSTGEVYCAGSNSSGQLGDGTTTARSTPVRVVGLGNGAHQVVGLASGFSHNCAILTDGTVQCWGDNSSGQLGDGTVSKALTPVSTLGIAGVSSLAAGREHTCAVFVDGHVECWGDNLFGQLGNNYSPEDSRVPAAVVEPTANSTAAMADARGIAAGRDHTCAVLRAGTVYCWGTGHFGQLGNGAFGGAFRPVAVSQIDSAEQLTSGHDHVCALLAGGSLRCWGLGTLGALGDGVALNRSVPVTVSGIFSAVSVAGGEHHTCAAMANGRVSCWGYSPGGGLGLPSNTSTSLPQQVPALQDVVQLAASRDHTCAIQRDSSFGCWGRNDNGELGDSSTTQRNAPPDPEPLGWVAMPIRRGPLVNDVDGNGCEDP